MTKNHLKRLNSPKAWSIKKKGMVFVTRPNVSGYKLENAMPLSIVIRDILDYAKTSREVKYIITNKPVLVDGKRRDDHRFGVGLFSVLSFPDVKKNFRMVFNENNRFAFKELDAGEAALKPLKVTSKAKYKGKTQLCFFDGRTMLADKDDLKVGDSVIFSLADNKIKEVFKLAKGAMIILIGGKHLGDTGFVEDVISSRIIYKNKKGESFETLKKYAFVIGKDKAALKSLV